MRGRSPTPNPPGISRIERKRHETVFHWEGWPKKLGPRLRIPKRKPTGRSRGRPAMSLAESIRYFIVEARVKTYRAQV